MSKTKITGVLTVIIAILTAVVNFLTEDDAALPAEDPAIVEVEMEPAAEDAGAADLAEEDVDP
tara:strand:+ start:635 stop:823 length:189 start_codon:yes stop_codon:yes gene_type:complete